jgi:glycosyltransferase involved in cell wall biosynthesis
MKNNHIDISIALVTWNRVKYLEIGLKALLHALSPELRHEILIMDNASTDGTLELVKGIAQANKEIKVFSNTKNIGFVAYNKLFFKARGDVIIEVDDDVISFPHEFDKKLKECLEKYFDYGFIALDTIRNEYTDGGRPNAGSGRIDKRDSCIVEEGDARGYCAAFRRKDYRLIRPLTWFFPFSLEHPQDYVISGLMRRILKRKSGVLIDEKCLHANGPLYAKKFGRVDFDITKMKNAKCEDRVAKYIEAMNEGRVYSP